MLEVQPLMQPPGAIVYGWDPQAEVSAQDRTEILRGLRLYQVLMFHKHAPPGDKDLTHFAASFGDLVKGSEWFGEIGDYAEILPVHNLVDDDGVPLGTGASAALAWHTDYSYLPTLGQESFF